MIVRRVEALGCFLDTEDGRNLLAGYRRAANILRIEEKKDGRAYDGAPDLGSSTSRGRSRRRPWRSRSTGSGSRPNGRRGRGFRTSHAGALAPARAGQFVFERVTVNADDFHLRENRLKLLNAFREATRSVADFSRIEG